MSYLGLAGIACAAGAAYVAYAAYLPPGERGAVPDRKVRTKPQVTLYYLRECQLSKDFKMTWDVEKSRHPGLTYVEIDCAEGFPEGITGVPTVRLDAIELGGEDLAGKLHRVLEAAS